MNNQRWNDQRDSYRPAGEVIDTRRYEVASIDDDTTPKAFVEGHHYSGSYPAARFRFGLYRGPLLVGVAVFSIPCNNLTLTNVFPVPPIEATELGRFVLLDDVPGNGETWFLARCFELLRRESIVGVVSFSDPAARTNARGEQVFGGHVGTIYQAHNAVLLGRSKARPLQLLPDGTVLNDRTRQKLIDRERGWQGVHDLLVEHGADAARLDAGEVKAEIARITRTLRHPGNFKYAWGLTKTMRRHMVKPKKPKAYPKLHTARAA